MQCAFNCTKHAKIYDLRHTIADLANKQRLAGETPISGTHAHPECIVTELNRVERKLKRKGLCTTSTSSSPSRSSSSS